MMPAAYTSQAVSGWLRRVWRKQFANGAVQPPTEVFEQVQANILLAHLDPMEGGFGNAQLPRKVPVWACPRVAAVVRVLISAAAVPYLGLIGYNLSRMWDKCHISLLQHAVCHAPSHLAAEREGHHNDYR